VSINDTKMSRLLITLAGEDILKIKNNMGMIPAAMSTDSRMKIELGGSQPFGRNNSISVMTTRHRPERLKTPNYTNALNSVLKGDQLNQLVSELQGSTKNLNKLGGPNLGSSYKGKGPG